MDSYENKMVAVSRELRDVLEREQDDIVKCNIAGMQHYVLIKENLIKEMQDPANNALWYSEADIPELQSLMKRIVELTASNEKLLFNTREQVAAKLTALQTVRKAVKAYRASK